MMEHISEHEVTLNNASKRETELDSSERKVRKKRRSSFASKRRSITEVFSHEGQGTDSDIVSSGSSESTQGSDGGSQPTKLTTNPLNMRMDEIIAEAQKNIDRLNQEYSGWKQLLKSLQKEKEEGVTLLESGDIIEAKAIPQELKDLAHAEYIKCQLLDFPSLVNKTEKCLIDRQFAMEKCLYDMQSMKTVMNTIKCYNQQMKQAPVSLQLNLTDDLSHPSNPSLSTFDDDLSDSYFNGSPLLSDTKSQLEWLMNN